MPTERGFVETLGVGRAGLVEAAVLHGDGSRAIYTVADLDADPERFNERLSKFGILRDAMDRAEPVEIEFDRSDGFRPVESVKRLTRDALERPEETSVASGMVVGLSVSFEVNINPFGEASDRAMLALLTGTGVVNFVIRLQAPERHAAMAMVDIARDAQASGASVTVTFGTKNREVMQIARDDLAGASGQETEQFSAFVEEITHTPVSNLMLVAVTTAPEFVLEGNVVPLEGFTPELRNLAVVYNSPEYLLLQAALRDKLRVELMTLRPRERDDPDKQPDEPVGDEIPRNDVTGIARYAEAKPAAMSGDSKLRTEAMGKATRATYLLRGATLQHALCSASRPVWIEVNRRALDVGPDEECIEGLPSSDMRPQTIRELNLPYRAAWIGYGCFNHGVYRIQIATDRDVTVFVDGEEICLHRDKAGDTVFGHACLEGDHEIRIVFENWKCKAKFDMDVYRIR